MARLIYSSIASVDGYIADQDGRFDWAAPDEEVHAFVNDLERPVGTYLLGRIRHDGLLGEPAGPRQGAAGVPGLRGDLAVGRQGRVLEVAASGLQREDPHRAG